MTRTLLVFSMITAILAAVFTAQAQTTARVYRVGWINPWSIAEFTGDSNPRFNTFRQEMRQRGYVEGQNLVLELRSVEARPERIFAVVSELVRLNVDIIVAVANPTVQAVQQVTSFAYDNQGNRTFIYNADGYNVTNWYDSLGRLITTGDGPGASRRPSSRWTRDARASMAPIDVEAFRVAY